MSKSKKSNKSKTYLLPLLSEVINLNEDTIGFIDNTYMFDSKNEYKDAFFIELKNDFSNPEYTKYEHALTENDYYLNSIDYDNGISLFIFKFPEEYLNERNLFLKGKYSKFEQDAKDLIKEFWTEIYGTDNHAINFLIKIKLVLNKEKRLKEKLEKSLGVTLSDNAELGDLVDKTSETIKLTYESKNSKI